MPLQQCVDEASSHPAQGYQVSIAAVGRASGEKTGIILAFPVPLTLVIKMLSEIRLDGGPKLHQLSVLLGLSDVLSAEVMLASLEKSQVSR